MTAFRWNTGTAFLLLMGMAGGLLIFLFYDGLSYMAVEQWLRDEYSHGYLLPVIAGYFVWQKKNRLSAIVYNGSWIGVLVFCLGLLGFPVRTSRITLIPASDCRALAARPGYSVLDKRKIRVVLDYDISHWRESLGGMLILLRNIG